RVHHDDLDIACGPVLGMSGQWDDQRAEKQVPSGKHAQTRCLLPLAEPRESSDPRLSRVGIARLLAMEVPSAREPTLDRAPLCHPKLLVWAMVPLLNCSLQDRRNQFKCSILYTLLLLVDAAILRSSAVARRPGF